MTSRESRFSRLCGNNKREHGNNKAEEGMMIREIGKSEEDIEFGSIGMAGL